VTRLNDALARAGRTQTGVADTASVSDDPSGVVPSSWRFDADDLAPELAPESKPDPAELLLSEQKAADAQSEIDAFERSASTFPALRTLVVGPNPNPALVEQYRHLAAALHHAQLRTGARTVMVASAVQAEGKTTTATNLALTLSESHQRRVLLIDADLRRPSIHAMLQLSNRTGLSDTLKDVSPNARVPLHKVTPNLSVITAGRATEDPMSALVSDMMRRFLEEAAAQYDWVVVDTPPVALLSDANLLAAMIDLAVLVIGASRTPYPLVRRAVEALGPSKVIGVVLNRAERSALSSAYGYYGSSYTYGDPMPPKKGWSLPFWKGR